MRPDCPLAGLVSEKHSGMTARTLRSAFFCKVRDGGTDAERTKQLKAHGGNESSYSPLARGAEVLVIVDVTMIQSFQGC